MVCKATRLLRPFSIEKKVALQSRVDCIAYIKYIKVHLHELCTNVKYLLIKHKPLSGQDATDAFETIHGHSDEAKEMMQAFCVGQYVDVSFFHTHHISQIQ